MAYCVRCHAWFDRAYEESWKTMCYPCWKKSKDSKPGSYKSRHQYRPRPVYHSDAAVSDEVLREKLPSLIRLCHPDKHGNSEAANEVTKWLLEVRKKL